jgi:hypothetical protein
MSSLTGDFIPEMKATTSTKMLNFQAVGIEVIKQQENLVQILTRYLRGQRYLPDWYAVLTSVCPEMSNFVQDQGL